VIFLILLHSSSSLLLLSSSLLLLLLLLLYSHFLLIFAIIFLPNFAPTHVIATPTIIGVSPSALYLCDPSKGSTVKTIPDHLIYSVVWFWSSIRYFHSIPDFNRLMRMIAPF
jgi:hypothetical protein